MSRNKPESQQEAHTQDIRTAESEQARDKLLGDSLAFIPESQRLQKAVIEPLQAGITDGIDFLRNRSQQGGPLWDKISQLFDAVGEQTRIQQDQYEKVFGDQTASILKDIGVVAVSHKDTGNGKHHYVLEFGDKKSGHVKNAEIKHGSAIEFDEERQGGKIVLSDIKGLQVKKDGNPFTATVDRVEISEEPNGNVTVVGHGHWLMFSGSKRITFDTNGQAVEEQDGRH